MSALLPRSCSAVWEECGCLVLSRKKILDIRGSEPNGRPVLNVAINFVIINVASAINIAQVVITRAMSALEGLSRIHGPGDRSHREYGSPT